MARPKQRTTETMSVSEARPHFSDDLNRVREHDVRIVVEKSGIPVAAVVSIDDMRWREGLEKDRVGRMNDLRESLEVTRKEFRRIPSDEIEQEIQKAIDEVDAERHRQAIPAEHQ